jgi:hypothetical protein
MALYVVIWQENQPGIVFYETVYSRLFTILSSLGFNDQLLARVDGRVCRKFVHFRELGDGQSVLFADAVKRISLADNMMGYGRFLRFFFGGFLCRFSRRPRTFCR